MLKLMSNVSNGVKSYSCLSTDTLPVNVEGKEKVSHQGDSALVMNVTTNELEFWVFDEENNIWRQG